MDLSTPNDRPGRCAKCKGSGRYAWGAVTNGKPQFTGRCNACQGSGHQTKNDIARNHAFNRHQVRRIFAAGF
jgi:DnaJ-class molecular chaperone